MFMQAQNRQSRIFSESRMGRKTVAEVQKKYFQTRRNLFLLAGMASSYRHLCSFHYSSRENSRRRNFFLAFRLFINANESINEPEYETKLFLEKTHENIHIFISPQREIFHKWDEISFRRFFCLEKHISAVISAAHTEAICVSVTKRPRGKC